MIAVKTVFDEKTYRGDRNYHHRWSHTSRLFDSEFVDHKPGEEHGRQEVAMMTAMFTDEEYKMMDMAILEMVRYMRKDKYPPHLYESISIMEELASRVILTWTQQFTDENVPME